jgi:NAD(P)-dependent dehydrogenase (short-subunit alcohol dehydrogenase family)
MSTPGHESEREIAHEPVELVGPRGRQRGRENERGHRIEPLARHCLDAKMGLRARVPGRSVSHREKQKREPRSFCGPGRLAICLAAIRALLRGAGKRVARMSVDNKVAVVTGASRGMGEGIVNALLARNYRVVGTSRSIETSSHPHYVTIPGDIGDPAVGERVVAAALEHFGRLDSLINNAGAFVAGDIAGTTDAQYRQVLRTNLDGFFNVTRHAVNAMRRRGGGHIVQITATLAEHALANVPSVMASITKGGLNAATRGLAVELAKDKIRVNAVAPGMIWTPLHAAGTKEALAGFAPLNRVGEIEDVVKAILYLEDALFVTGDILHVDGGWIAGH